MSELKSVVSATASGPLIALSGEADLGTAAAMGELLSAQVESENTTHVTLDLSQVSFMDSMAVRLLIMAGKLLRARGGTLMLTQPQVEVARTLEMMGVEQIMTVQGGAWRGSA